MTSYKIRKHISFKCQFCQRRAQSTEVNGQLDRVECLTCNTRLDSDTTQIMYQSLIRQYVIQEGRNANRRFLRDRGVARIPLTQVSNEFYDPQWPFILVIEGDAESI